MADPIIKADLQDLYRAGKETFPESAGLVADTASSLADAHAAWQNQLGPTGRPQPLADAVAINAEVFALMRRAAQTLDDAGVVMVAVANEFAATDARAADAARELTKLVHEQPYRPSIPPPLPGAGA